VIVGLAPGLRGANRTGRPFTGDYAGEVLYPALLAHGLARGRFTADPEDGLELVGARIANAVRCVPPQNKPTPAEIATCNRFLVPELTAGAPPRVILALGRVAHAAALRALGIPASRFPFGHGAEHRLPTGQALIASYHTSRYNVNTGVLTPAMFDEVVRRAAALVAEGV
jgi:uracil-DNA glycosylase family 4